MAYRPSQPLVHQADSPATMDFDASSVVSAATSDRPFDANGINIDDPDVRLAAEALGDLRADFVSSPPDTGSLSPRARSAQRSPPSQRPQSPQPEPLLSLLTTSHPLVASTIGGASSAYGGAKNFSPRFKSGAEYVEGYLTPIANTVNSVGRVTGVEGGVRWFLGAGRRHAAPLDAESCCTSNKRRKVDNDDAPLKTLWADEHPLAHASFRTSRRLSSTSTIDTLPAYDDVRSPAYTEAAPPPNPPRSSPSTAPWQSRLILSTSGLSVSMSVESLRSLRYCLQWLRWTNAHISRIMGSLKAALDEFEKAALPPSPPRDLEASGGADDATPEPAAERSRAELANRINSLKTDVLRTLQDAINTVSRYAGGALPENARQLVRRHMTSLPQRFRIATMSSAADGADGRDGESAIRDGAQKVLVLAKEGLDMVTQISGVVDGTIVSAEEWCERMGRKRQSSRDDDEQQPQQREQQREPQEPQPMLPRHEPNGDVKMG
ncbi:hypothetical protein CDD83_594 [Cordyceps sp. RAO-2017]|nr:hypothetical protein CDD83_594 [Cordyceps sp. RAO-2017]